MMLKELGLRWRRRWGDPEGAEAGFIAVELVAVTHAGAGDGVWLGTGGTIGVLPHGPERPIGRHDGGGSILRQPEPAFLEHGIGAGAEQVLNVVAGIEAGVPARLFIDMSDEGASLLKGHAGSLTVIFKIENQEDLIVGLYDIEEVLGLLDAVAAGAKMIGAPEQVVVKGA